MKKILLIIPILLSYSLKSMEDPHSNINSTMESVRPGNQVSELKVSRKILEGICEVADVLGKRKQTEEHGNQNQSKKAKRFECNKCGRLLSSQSKLNRHMETHNTGKPFECNEDGCQEKFKTKARFKRHKESVHDPKKVCGINGCQYKTGSISDFNRHKDRHEKQKDLTCDTCDYRCTLRSDLNRHKDTHNTGKLHECDVEGCQKKCKTASALRSHRNRSHDSKTICGIHGCPYKTASISDLKRHKDRIHEGRKGYACDQCDYVCASQSNLKEHEQTHNTGKPYECDVEGCQKKFKTDASLRMHRKSNHGSKEVCGIDECTL